MTNFALNAWDATLKFWMTPRKKAADFILALWLLLLLIIMGKICMGVFFFRISFQRLSVLGYFITTHTLIQQCRQQSQSLSIHLPYQSTPLSPTTTESLLYGLAFLAGTTLFFFSAWTASSPYILPLLLPLLMTGYIGFCLQLNDSDKLAHQLFGNSNWQQTYSVIKKHTETIFSASPSYIKADGKKIALQHQDKRISAYASQLDLETKLKEIGHVTYSWHTPKQLCQTLARGVFLIGLGIIINTLTAEPTYFNVHTTVQQTFFSMFSDGISNQAAMLLSKITTFLQPACWLSGTYHCLQLATAMLYRQPMTKGMPHPQTPIGTLKKINNKLMVHTLVKKPTQITETHSETTEWQHNQHWSDIELTKQKAYFLPTYTSLWQQALARINPCKASTSYTGLDSATDWLRKKPNEAVFTFHPLHLLWQNHLVPLLCPWMSFFIVNQHERRQGIWLNADMTPEEIQKICHDRYASDAQSVTVLAGIFLTLALSPVLPIGKVIILSSYLAILPCISNSLVRLAQRTWRYSISPVLFFTTLLPRRLLATLFFVQQGCRHFLQNAQLTQITPFLTTKNAEKRSPLSLMLHQTFCPAGMRNHPTEKSDPHHYLINCVRNLKFVFESYAKPENILSEKTKDWLHWQQKHHFLLQGNSLTTLTQRYRLQNLQNHLSPPTALLDELHTNAKLLAQELSDATTAYLNTVQTLSKHLSNQPTRGYNDVTMKKSHHHWQQELSKIKTQVQLNHSNASQCLKHFDALQIAWQQGRPLVSNDLINTAPKSMDDLWQTGQAITNQIQHIEQFSQTFSKAQCKKIHSDIQAIKVKRESSLNLFTTSTQWHLLTLIKKNTLDLLNLNLKPQQRMQALTELKQLCTHLQSIRGTCSTIDIILSKPDNLFSSIERYRLLLEKPKQMERVLECTTVKNLQQIYATYNIENSLKAPHNINPDLSKRLMLPVKNLVTSVHHHLLARRAQHDFKENQHQDKVKTHTTTDHEWKACRQHLAEVMKVIHHDMPQGYTFSRIPNFCDRLYEEPLLLVPHS